MAVADRAQFTDVCVDGIPVGPGYGVAVERERAVENPSPADLVLGRTRFKPGPRIEKWLTRESPLGTYVPIRRLPDDAVLTAKDADGNTYIG